MKKLISAAINYVREWGNGPECISPEVLAQRPAPTYNIVNKPRYEGQPPLTIPQAYAWGYNLESFGRDVDGKLCFKFKECKHDLLLLPENGGGITITTRVKDIA